MIKTYFRSSYGPQVAAEAQWRPELRRVNERHVLLSSLQQRIRIVMSILLFPVSLRSSHQAFILLLLCIAILNSSSDLLHVLLTRCCHEHGVQAVRLSSAPRFFLRTAFPLRVHVIRDVTCCHGALLSLPTEKRDLGSYTWRLTCRTPIGCLLKLPHTNPATLVTLISLSVRVSVPSTGVAEAVYCISPACDARWRTCVAGSGDQRLTSARPLGP